MQVTVMDMSCLQLFHKQRMGRGQQSSESHSADIAPSYLVGLTALLLWHGVNVCMHPFLSGVPHTQAATGACCMCAVHGSEIKHPVSASAERLKQSLSFCACNWNSLSMQAGWYLPLRVVYAPESITAYFAFVWHFLGMPWIDQTMSWDGIHHYATLQALLLVKSLDGSDCLMSDVMIWFGNLRLY